MEVDLGQGRSERGDVVEETSVKAVMESLEFFLAFEEQRAQWGPPTGGDETLQLTDRFQISLPTKLDHVQLWHPQQAVE